MSVDTQLGDPSSFCCDSLLDTERILKAEVVSVASRQKSSEIPLLEAGLGNRTVVFALVYCLQIFL